jgi:hypothetical protein
MQDQGQNIPVGAKRELLPAPAAAPPDPWRPGRAGGSGVPMGLPEGGRRRCRRSRSRSKSRLIIVPREVLFPICDFVTG